MRTSKVLTKALSVLLCAAMVVSATGCGKKKSGGNEIDLKQVSYSMETIEGLTGRICAIDPGKDTVYVATTESEDMTEYPEGYDEEDYSEDVEIDYKYVNTIYLYSMTPEGKDVKQLFSEQLEDIWGMDDMTVLPDNTIVCLYSGYNDETEFTESMLQLFGPDGKKAGSLSLNDFFDDPSYAYVQDLTSDKDGNIVLQADDKIIVIDREGKELLRLTVNGYINSMCRDRDGKIVACVNEEEGVSVKTVDMAAKGFTKTTMAEGTINRMLTGFGDYEYCVDAGQGIDGADYNGNRKAVLNWVGSNLEGQYINQITSLGDGNFMAYYFDYEEDEETETLIRLRKMDPSEVENRQVIVYGGTYINEDITKEAIKFNRSQSQYQIVIRDYSSFDDPEGKMNADLLAGDVPDIIDMAWLPEEKYIGKGLLMDLYPLMEKDSDVKKEDFFENVLKTLETNGKLYRIAPTYQLTLLAGSKDDIGDKTNIQITDIMELEKKYKDGKAFSIDSTKGTVLSTLCSNMLDSFVDWDTGKCSFDSEEFAQMLEYANSYKTEEEINYDEMSDFVSNIREKKQLFVELWSLSYEDVELYDALYDHKVAFVGYPSREEGYGARFTNVIGIYSKTPNVEGSWAFLKHLLSREYLSSSEYDHSMPLRKDVFEDDIKKVTSTKTYTDDFGVERQPLDYSYGISEDLEVPIKPLNKDQEQIIRDLVAGVSHRFSSDSDIQGIIDEEAGALFSGQKSAKDVGGIIQNRVSTYVNETR